MPNNWDGSKQRNFHGSCQVSCQGKWLQSCCQAQGKRCTADDLTHESSVTMDSWVALARPTAACSCCAGRRRASSPPPPRPSRWAVNLRTRVDQPIFLSSRAVHLSIGPATEAAHFPRTRSPRPTFRSNLSASARSSPGATSQPS